MKNVWNIFTKPKILYRDDGYYIFRFDTVSDRDRVIQSSPYTFHNKPFILKNWSINFVFDPDYLIVIPLWVKFSSLLVGYWSTKSLGKLASVVGKLMCTDLFIAEIDRISYARVLVSHPLPNSLELHTLAGVIHQNIEYDWRPKYCC